MLRQIFIPGTRVISELPNGDIGPGVVIGRAVPSYEYDIIYAVRLDADGKVVSVPSRHIDRIEY